MLLGCVVIALAIPALAQEAKHAESAKENPLAKYLAVPGAKTTLPVSAAKKPFPLDFVIDARARFENFHYQMGGDHALYYNGHLSEMMPTAISQPNEKYRSLEVALNPRIGKQVAFAVKEGDLILDEYVVHPNHRVQGVMMIHKGKIVYQQYPGMNPMDVHVWMSAAKSTVGLIIAQMEAEGKIDMQNSVADYVPELKGTSWDGIKMIDAINMSTALQLDETMDSLLDPSSIIVRFFSAEFGFPNPATGKVEKWLDILKEAEKAPGQKPGERFSYSSAVTQVAVLAAEKVDNKAWARLFQDRVWGKVGARGPILMNLTPDGTAVAHGLLSSTLEDFARYGMLYTPSWDKVAFEPVVSARVLKRIQTAGNPAAFRTAYPEAKDNGPGAYFGEAPMANSFQFDAVFEDGALWKHGNLGQGIYIDPKRDFVGVYFSTNGYIPPYGEDKMPGYLRRAAKLLAGK